MGVGAGTILDYVDHEIQVALDRPVADRDGVMYLVENRLGLFEPVRFAVKESASPKREHGVGFRFQTMWKDRRSARSSAWSAATI